MRTLIIDADTLVYKATLSAEREVQWDESLFTLHSELKDAIVHFDDAVNQLKERLQATNVVMVLSDYTEPWRVKVMPSYKAHRKKLGMRKPLCYKALREYVHEVYTTYQRPGLEGDDVGGILLTASKPIEGQKIFVSIDKDMKTLPGLHFNQDKAPWASDEWWPYIVEITQAEADYWHLMQALTGDKTDGYPGCPGIGPKTAEKILAPFAEHDGSRFDVKGAWQEVLKAYKKAGLGEEAALENARVARICRATDFDFKQKEVKLWTP